MQILTVEDEEYTANAMRILLEKKLRAIVDIAPGYRQARDLLHSKSYDLITVDYQLPDGDGLALLDEIMCNNGKTPVIMVTGHGDEQTAISAFKHGASGYVVKDMRMSTMLVEEVRSALARSDLIKAESALRESEDKYRTLFETMLNGFAFHEIVTDDKGQPVDYIFIEVNSAFKKMTGLKAENIIGNRVTEVLPGIEKDPADWIGRYGRVALEGEDEKFEAYSEPLKQWFSVYAYSPREHYFATLFEDITERKQAEEKLRESEERYRQLFDNMVEGFALCELILDDSGIPVDFIWIEANDAFEKLIGWKNVAGRKLSDFNPEVKENRDDKNLDTFKRVVTTGVPEKIETWSEPLSIWLSMKVYRPMDGCFAVVFENITERKTAEETKRTSESILKAAERISKAGGWEYSIPENDMYWTEETYRIHELDPNSTAPRDADQLIQRSIDCYDPEDRDLIMSSFNRCLREGVPYDLEVPFTTCSGKRLWVRTVAEAVYDEGKIVKVVGNLMDISDRKDIEEKLRTANAELEKLVRHNEEN